MNDFPLIFRFHAIQHMVLRGIGEVEVREVLEDGEVIEAYPDELPYPSRLVLGRPSGRPIHVVAMDDPDARVTVIISVYQPDSHRWANGFRKRKRP